jgi:DNA topoisomerase-3
MTLLRGLGVNELTAPELTGEWEYKLSQMEKGKISRDEFMREIAQMTQVIVKRAKEYNNETIPGDYATLQTPCPNCGGVVKENYRRFACTKCDFNMSKTPGSRQFELAEVEELLKNRTIGPMQGFRSKMGRPFAAILRIVRDEDINNFKLEFDFGQNDEEGENGEGVDFTGQTPLGPCPKCNGGVYEMGLAYVCEHSVAKPKTCDFRSGRIILQQEILPEQMAKLLNEGKTDLLPGFVSQRTRRPFKAFLVKGKDGKISFEFEERKAKPGAKVKAKPVADEGEGEEAAEVTAPIKPAAKKAAAGKAPAKAAAKKPAAKKAPAKRAAAAKK